MVNIKCEVVWKLLRDYDFEFEIELSADLTCIICKKVLRNAYQSPCACRFCLECISDYLDGEEKFCPGQMEDCKEHKLNLDKDIQIDYVINRKISNLKVKCPDHYCQCKVELKYLEEHMKTHMIKCPFFTMGCDKPRSAVERMTDHLHAESYNHTNMLIEFVGNLKIEFASVKENLKHTQDSLHEKDLFNVEIKRTVQQLQNENDRKGDEIEKLKTDIVKWQFENKKLKEDVQSSENEIITITKALETQQESIKRLHGSREENIEEIKEIFTLKSDLTSYKHEHEKLCEEMKIRKNEIIQINDNLKSKQKSITKLENLLKNLKKPETKEYEKAFEKAEVAKGDSAKLINDNNAEPEKNLEQFQKMVGKIINDIKHTPTPFEVDKMFREMFNNLTEDEANEYVSKSSLLVAHTFKDNFSPFEWKIDNFFNKWKLAREGIDPYIMSGDFYSHKSGYKLILGVYPDGFDTEQGTFLSVFFHIAKGDDDDSLQWPMRHELSISLMDQESGVPHTTEKFKYETAEKPFLPSYDKPKTAINLGYGDTQFIDLLTLFNNKKLFRNDSIVLKCSVDMTS